MTDTGPPYPPLPLAGDNGIGQFIIGVSPLGTLPSFDVWSTIIAQYANSPILTRLIENLFAYLDQTENLDAFFDKIWNILTAEGEGLDIWGRIVGVSRTLQVATGSWLGFNEALPGSLGFNDARPMVFAPAFGFEEAAGQPFGQSTFNLHQQWSDNALVGGIFFDGAALTSNYQLSDTAYRQLIFAKAAANITNGSIPAINRILMTLFPNRGNCYVTEGQVVDPWFGFAEQQNTLGFNQASFYSGSSLHTMTMTYTFQFQLAPVELAIVEQSGVLPKPTGVAASVVILQGG